VSDRPPRGARLRSSATTGTGTGRREGAEALLFVSFNPAVVEEELLVSPKSKNPLLVVVEEAAQL
jgi:hypothetical protein